MKDEYRGKWKVVELTDNKIVANGLTYEDAVRYANKLARLDPCDDGGDKPRYQYDVKKKKKRRS